MNGTAARSSRLAGITLAAMLSTACGSSSASAPQPEALGYFPAWLGDDWQNLDWSLYERLVYFSVNIGGSGQLLGAPGAEAGAKPFFAACRRRGTPCELAIGLFDVETFNRVFSDPSRYQRLAADLHELLLKLDAHGIHLDIEMFEPVDAAARTGVNRFVRKLAERLEAGDEARDLSVFVTMGPAAQNVYDPDVMSLFERFVIQGYDAHWATGPTAGPIAPLQGPDRLSWDNILADAEQLGIPRERMLFAVPYYGYEWPVESKLPRASALGPAREISYALRDEHRLPKITASAKEMVARHGKQRDPESGSPYYVFRSEEGELFQGWFEDETSLRDKYTFILQHELLGVAVFPVRYDAGKLDPLLQEHFPPR